MPLIVCNMNHLCSVFKRAWVFLDGYRKCDTQGHFPLSRLQTPIATFPII